MNLLSPPTLSSIDEPTLCAGLLHADRKTLLRLQDLAGINECPFDCVPVYLPCPKHTTWVRWFAELSEKTQLKRYAKCREIARRWEEQAGEFTDPGEVWEAFRRKDPANCDCPTRAPIPCAHIVLKPWYLPLQAQILLRRLLDRANVEPMSGRNTGRQTRALALAGLSPDMQRKVTDRFHQDGGVQKAKNAVREWFLEIKNCQIKPLACP
jgi:hypothetical protein